MSSFFPDAVKNISHMLTRRVSTLSPWRTLGYSTTTKPSQPPEPRPYKPIERPAKDIEDSIEVTTPENKGLLGHLFSRRGKQLPRKNEPGDIARGLEASQRVVRDGILDPRYRPAARRVTAIICALPIALYLSYELFERRFMGKEQKVRPVRPATINEGMK
ncbi:hypothetical protein LTR17_024117 [Elasticomyces elasticus]|nr:hypothetical protein LTR17_024117 [Elasticomyces elasticus]